jgi:hypothetical protein
LIAWLTCRAVASREGGSIRSLVQTKTLLSILPMIGGAALGFGMSAPAWLAVLDYVHGSARGITSGAAHWQWLVPLSGLPGLVLPCWTVNWADFSTRLMPHSATELACGLVAPVAVIAALFNHGRAFVKKLRWEFLLLLLLLLLCLLPTAGVFRWSFRWLPFFHLVLALCAAEALRQIPRSATAATTALVLVAFIAVTMSIFHLGGKYAFPLTWIFLALAAVWALSEFFMRNDLLRDWMPACVTFAAFLATYLCIPPNCGVPKYNLSEELTKPAPLDPQRLYLSVYPPAEFNYRTEMKPGPVGRVVRLGSTSMWAGLRFLNGYSPILAAGVAREFKFAIHGEIDPDVGQYLLEYQAGPDGELARMGVDGITIANEIVVDPQPPSEWQLAVVTGEGRVFYRKGTPLPIVRSITSIRSRPNEEFVSAAISRIADSRNRVEVDVDVPGGEHPALLSFSRPYFRGYEARLDARKLLVNFHRGLFPIVEVPAGLRGHLVLSYRPAWLIYGGGLSILCTMIFVGSVVVAVRCSHRAARGVSRP